MEIKKVRKQINKLNNLFNSIEEEGSVSKIERDLLKAYVVSLYEKIITEANFKGPVNDKGSNNIVKKEMTQKASNVASGTLEEESILEAISMENIETVATIAENGIAVPSVNTEVIDISQIGEVTDQEELDSLFQIEEGNDLSDRLSKLPIADLNMAISINEKIFTINELFGGDSNRYQEVITQLNNMASYVEATEYLKNGAAIDYNWHEETKIKKASKFINTIHRRYL